jgi:hypothetical protein
MIGEQEHVCRVARSPEMMVLRLVEEMTNNTPILCTTFVSFYLSLASLKLN